MSVVKVLSHLNPDAMTGADVVIIISPRSTPDILLPQLSLPLHYYFWCHWRRERPQLPWLIDMRTPFKNRIAFESEFEDRFGLKLARDFRFRSLCPPLVDVCFFQPNLSLVEELAVRVRAITRGFAKNVDILVVITEDTSTWFEEIVRSHSNGKIVLFKHLQKKKKLNNQFLLII